MGRLFSYPDREGGIPMAVLMIMAVATEAINESKMIEAASKTSTLGDLVQIGLVIVCIGLAWYGIQQIRLELFLRNSKSGAAKILQILLSIALGYQVARFTIDYISWSLSWSGFR